MFEENALGGGEGVVEYIVFALLLGDPKTENELMLVACVRMVGAPFIVGIPGLDDKAVYPKDVCDIIV